MLGKAWNHATSPFVPDEDLMGSELSERIFDLGGNDRDVIGSVARRNAAHSSRVARVVTSSQTVPVVWISVKLRWNQRSRASSGEHLQNHRKLWTNPNPDLKIETSSKGAAKIFPNHRQRRTRGRIWSCTQTRHTKLEVLSCMHSSSKFLLYLYLSHSRHFVPELVCIPTV